MVPSADLVALKWQSLIASGDGQVQVLLRLMSLPTQQHLLRTVVQNLPPAERFWYVLSVMDALKDAKRDSNANGVIAHIMKNALSTWKIVNIESEW